jgi:predicted P-loop ATPase
MNAIPPRWTAWQELETLPRWVAWKPESWKGRSTKVPYSPITGKPAASDNPADWSDCETAAIAAEKMDAAGLGLILGDHEGLAIGGVDLDTCRDPETSIIEPWAVSVIERLGSYTEVSPSGSGVKVFFAYDGEALPSLQQAMGTSTGKQFKRGSGEHPPSIELYLARRYFAVTRQTLPELPAVPVFVPTATLLWLIQEGGPAFAGGKTAGKGSKDSSRSAIAFRTAAKVRAAGGTYDAFKAALRVDSTMAAWLVEKGLPNGEREARRAWERSGTASTRPDWLEHCQTASDGSPIGNLANAALALRTATEMEGLFRYDEMQRTVLVMSPLPGNGCAPVTEPRPIQDVDMMAVQESLQLAGLKRLGTETVQQAVTLCAHERAFHPVRDYLSGLRWDGTPRLGTWLHTYLGAEASPYSAGVGTMFLISMVARVHKPGCKADYMLVLEGVQGAMKSTACAILGGQWFSDNLPNIGGSDAVRLAQHLRGKWLIEVAELSAMSKAEGDDLKAFVSQQEERFIPKYGRNEVREPRQCVFIGTTNKAAYLRDETGARRFWPVKVGDALDVEGLARDRDQLFAEAVALYRDGAAWWPSRDFEAEHIRPQQDARYEADEWEQNILEWSQGLERITVSDALRMAVGLETTKIGTRESRRATAILERLGWKRRPSNGVRWWVRQ